jgi:hypothetical protein
VNHHTSYTENEHTTFTNATTGGDKFIKRSEVDKPYIPSKDLGEGLDVAIDHMLLAGALLPSLSITMSQCS